MDGLTRFSKYAAEDLADERQKVTQDAVTAYVKGTFLRTEEMSLQVIRELFEVVGKTLPDDHPPLDCSNSAYFVLGGHEKTDPLKMPDLIALLAKKHGGQGSALQMVSALGKERRP